MADDIVPQLTLDPEKTGREKVLGLAAGAVLKQRCHTYGPPADNFADIAALWTAYTGRKFTRGDVAIMIALVKVARLMENPQHLDSWTDLAGYAACGYEAALADEGEE